MDFQFNRRWNHKEELFICDQCDKEYENENSLDAHKSSHLAVGGKISCGECGKDLANRNSLAEHKKIHLGIKQVSVVISPAQNQILKGIIKINTPYRATNKFGSV